MAHPALAAWHQTLGDTKINFSPEVLARYSRTMQPQGTTPDCVLYPESSPRSTLT